MQSPIKENHYNDSDGNPGGGTTFGYGFAIGWQNGPVKRIDCDFPPAPNGAFVEDIIQAAIGRIKYYQESEFACVENERALSHLMCALARLNERTADRERRGVEGTHTK